MHLLDVTLPTPAENLALDEALLLEAEAGRGGEMLRLWEWPTPAVVLGAGCRLAEEVHESRCRDDGVAILRRASGGGTVLLGRGCLLYSLVLSYERHPALREISSSYRYVLDRVCVAVRGLAQNAEREGPSDLAANGYKFSGNAQQRKRRYFLHHGTLLYDFDIDLIGCYLPPPPRQPSYRDNRSHSDFVRNLPATAAELQSRLRQTWQVENAWADWPEAEVRRLVAEKYATPEWVRRR